MLGKRRVKSVSEGLIRSSRHTTLVFMYEEDSVKNEVEWPRKAEIMKATFLAVVKHATSSKTK